MTTSIELTVRNKDTVREFWRRIDASDYDGAFELLAEQYAFHTPEGRMLSAAGYREMITAVRGNVLKGDIQRSPLRLLAEGDTVATFFTVTGTRVDDSSFVCSFCLLYEVRDGLIYEVWETTGMQD
jgi:ketosteroid isomerase-like protein